MLIYFIIIKTAKLVHILHFITCWTIFRLRFFFFFLCIQASHGRPSLPLRRGPMLRKQRGFGCSTCRTTPTTSTGLAGRNSWNASASESTPGSSWAGWLLTTALCQINEPSATPSTKTRAALMEPAPAFPAPALLCPASEASETRLAPTAASTPTLTACPPLLRCPR